MRIDLHTHSKASDGYQSPTDLVSLAAHAGLDVFALTDHDSASGWVEAAEAAHDEGISLVRGMEISTKWEGAGVHLLAYLLDPTYEPLAAELSLVLEGRDSRLELIVDQLSANGLDLTVAEVQEQAGAAAAIGRPHIADVMVAKGMVANRDEAFARWLDIGTPGYVERYATSVDEMIGLVNAAGGVAVIAHPWSRESRRVLTAQTVAHLKDCGLAGIEVDHYDHDRGDRQRLRALATELDLIVTGSSDYHGAGRTNDHLGCNLTADNQLERLLATAADNAKRSGRRTPQVVGR